MSNICIVLYLYKEGPFGTKLSTYFTLIWSSISPAVFFGEGGVGVRGGVGVLGGVGVRGGVTIFSGVGSRSGM